MSKLTSCDEGFYMADSFDRDALYFCAPQGTSRAMTATASISPYSDSIATLNSSCESFTSSIDKVNNVIKQLSKKLGVSLNADGNIVEDCKVSHWSRLKRNDLLTLRVRG